MIFIEPGWIDQAAFHLPGFYDPLSAISHLCGSALFLVLGGLLLRRGRGDPLRLTFLSVYAFACVFLFSMSGVYHMMTGGGTARAIMARLDHAAIFVLIAATFTPLHGLLFRGWLRWAPLGFIWAATAAAIALKTVFFTSLAESVGLTLYLTLGWLGAGSGILVARRYGLRFVAPLLWGGAAYSIGGAMEFLGRPTLVSGVVGPHEVFHIAVLVGAVFHFAFVWRFADGSPLSRRLVRSRRLTRKGNAVNVEFVGEPECDLHQDLVLWEAVADGRQIRCRFTREAVRSVMPSPADKGDLRARAASHRDVFTRLVAGKLAELSGEWPTELTITEADVPNGR